MCRAAFIMRKEEYKKEWNECYNDKACKDHPALLPCEIILHNQGNRRKNRDMRRGTKPRKSRRSASAIFNITVNTCIRN